MIIEINEEIVICSAYHIDGIDELDLRDIVLVRDMY